MSARMAMGIIIAMIFISFFIGEISGTTFTLMSPTLLTLVMSGEITAVIVASGTVGKGIAMSVFFGTLVGFILLSNIPIYIYGLIIFPLFIGLALALANVGNS